jgi:hypothetical protein
MRKRLNARISHASQGAHEGVRRGPTARNDDRDQRAANLLSTCDLKTALKMKPFYPLLASPGRVVEASRYHFCIIRATCGIAIRATCGIASGHGSANWRPRGANNF